MLVDKIPQKTKMDSKKQKVHKGVAILMEDEGLWGLAQCKLNCKEHVGSDKSFESISLFTEQLPLQIQFTKEKKNTENELHGITWLRQKFELATLFFDQLLLYT